MHSRGKRIAEQSAGNRQGHDEDSGLDRLAGDDQFRVAEVGLCFLDATGDGHKDLSVVLPPGGNGGADDARATAVAEFTAEPMVDPRSRMSLLRGRRAIVLENLMDGVEEGTEFGFDAGTSRCVTRWL